MTPQELEAVTPNVQPDTIYAELIELAHDQLRNEFQGQRIPFKSLKERIAELGESSTVTEEAYYNLARRLVHRGLLVPIRSDQGTRYQLGSESLWLEEGQLSELIDPDYPLLAVTIWRESLRQINEVPEEVWKELRERLRGESARELFHQAIVSYCDDFHAQIADLVEFEETPTPALARLRQEAEDSRSLLLRLTK